MPRNQWIELQGIYDLVSAGVSLDKEDYQPQSPSSQIPKWMRNVRNVLQYRKKTGEIEWDRAGKYRLG
ncbi:MAG: hypothetical protein JW725_05595 [Candidatus Babeliaceae bacterium]|nr:hypothetical protein [Candidatus Babeliaceae bacterium]